MFPDSKIRVLIMGPTWGRQDPGGLRVAPMNIAIWVIASYNTCDNLGLNANIIWLNVISMT